jgi:hypothetical protein
VFFRAGYRQHLVASWPPALDGVAEKVESGARVADDPSRPELEPRIAELEGTPEMDYGPSSRSRPVGDFPANAG